MTYVILMPWFLEPISILIKKRPTKIATSCSSQESSWFPGPSSVWYPVTTGQALRLRPDYGIARGLVLPNRLVG